MIVNENSMDDDARLKQGLKSQEIRYIMEDPNYDEIDLGSALMKLVGQWKIIFSIIIFGSILSIVFAFISPKTFLVDAIISRSSADELGDFGSQGLVDSAPENALLNFVDELVSADNQVETFIVSPLFASLSENSTLSPQQLFSGIRKEMTITRVKQDYYALEKNEKVPLKEIRISLKSTQPDLASNYIQLLLNKTHDRALASLSDDVLAIKENKISAVNNKLLALSSAAENSRIAKIQRLEETNLEQISKLELQFKLKVAAAEKTREIQIIRVEEALSIAKLLDIFEPITWDDLRKTRETSQITNEFGGTDQSKPLYFQGERILMAELKRLNARQDDKPFIDGLTEIETQIEELKNDPAIAALKARSNDAIYIETYDVLQQELYNLKIVPTDFSKTRLMIIRQNPLISAEPLQSPMLIVAIGIIMSGFLAMFIAIIRIILSREEATNSEA